MIRSNLSVLLAERNLRITKVSKDTGISRTTLTSLERNNGQGIQFNTLNKLCLYLDVTPNQLVSFFPFDIDVTYAHLIDDNHTKIEIGFTIFEKGVKFDCKMYSDVKLYLHNDKNIYFLNIDMSLFSPNYDDKLNNEIKVNNKIIINKFSQLSKPFLIDMEEEIINLVRSEIKNKTNFVFTNWEDTYCNWPKDITLK